MPTAHKRNYQAEYARRAQRARQGGSTFYKTRTTPGRPLDAVRDPIRWAEYIRRNSAAVERAADTRDGLLIFLERAIDARNELRLPVFACPPPHIAVEGRPHSIGRTLVDVGVYVEEGSLLPERDAQ